MLCLVSGARSAPTRYLHPAVLVIAEGGVRGQSAARLTQTPRPRPRPRPPARPAPTSAPNGGSAAPFLPSRARRCEWVEPPTCHRPRPVITFIPCMSCSCSAGCLCHIPVWRGGADRSGQCRRRSSSLRSARVASVRKVVSRSKFTEQMFTP